MNNVRAIAAVTDNTKRLLLASIIGAIMLSMRVEYSWGIGVAGKPDRVAEFSNSFGRTFEAVEIPDPAIEIQIQAPTLNGGNLIGSNKSFAGDMRTEQILLPTQNTGASNGFGIVGKLKISRKITFYNPKINVISKVLSGGISDIIHSCPEIKLQRGTGNSCISVGTPRWSNLYKSSLPSHRCIRGLSGDLKRLPKSLIFFNTSLRVSQPLVNSGLPHLLSGAPQSPSENGHSNTREGTNQTVIISSFADDPSNNIYVNAIGGLILAGAFGTLLAYLDGVFDEAKRNQVIKRSKIKKNAAKTVIK